MHINSFRLHICTSALSISSIRLQMLWRIAPLLCLLVSAPETTVACPSLCFWFLSYPLLLISSHSPFLYFYFINSFAREFCKCPSRPNCNPPGEITLGSLFLPLILPLILHSLFAFATCFTGAILQALLHEGTSLLILMWCVSHS